MSNGDGTKKPFIPVSLSDKVAKVFGDVRKAQLARATPDAFVQRVLAYMKEHQVDASVAVEALLTPSVVRESARGMTGALSDAALLEFARKGVMRAVEEAQRDDRGDGKAR